MINFLARIISIIANPIIVILPVPYILVLKTTHNSNLAIEWSLISFVFIAFVGIFVALGVHFKFFSDLDVSKRKQRSTLYAFALIVTIIYLITLFFLKGPPVLFITLLGLIVGLVIMGEINRKIKASIHVATISALITAAAIIYGGYSLFALFLIPLIAWSRVKTKRHSLNEAIIGGIFGVVFTIMIYVAMELKF